LAALASAAGWSAAFVVAALSGLAAALVVPVDGAARHRSVPALRHL